LKSLILLWKVLAQECANRCRTSATMDIKTVQGRSEHEGLSFLTITLAEFGKDTQKCLDQGFVAPDMFRSFSKHRCLPRFLGGFTERVFDRNTGVLLPTPDVDAILSIRQLTLIFGKIDLPCTPAREEKAISDYVECEKEVKAGFSNILEVDIARFSRMSDLLFSSLFSAVDKTIYDGDCVPKHGPGATADKLRGNSKFENRTWTDRLEEVFHCGDFLFPNARYFNEHYDDVRFLEPGSEMPVKVITVPKTQKAPRIIAVEPTCMQYAQQAVSEQLIREIEASYLDLYLGFDDQKPNQLMAQKGSLDGTLATLDLSEASDRVPNQLVRVMAHRWPSLLRALDASRSRKADVPGHGVLRLAKFASMGSALCFPMEAMYFLTLVFLGIEQELNTPLTKKDILSFSGQVRIYGDDIIVPVDYVHSVTHQLEHFGARVGAAKSFWTGRFRESCGKEYYEGHDVSIVKVRRVFPSSRKCVPEVISIVSLRNQLYFAGYWETVKWLDSRIGRVLNHFPYVTESSSVLGRNSFLGYETEREHETLHAPQVKGYVVSARLPRDPLSDSGALLKFFLKRGNLPVADRNHLERAGRPRAVDIKPRWASPF
jgi:hypothetical protein